MITSPVVSITDELITELEALAINATPGPWRYEAGEEDTDGPAAWPEVYARDVAIIGDEGFYGDNEQDEADAEYIALANPSTILAILAERAELKRQLAAASVDAERYRWLRGFERSNITVRDFKSHLHVEGMDAAIDAARWTQHE